MLLMRVYERGVGVDFAQRTTAASVIYPIKFKLHDLRVPMSCQIHVWIWKNIVLFMEKVWTFIIQLKKLTGCLKGQLFDIKKEKMKS